MDLIYVTYTQTLAWGGGGGKLGEGVIPCSPERSTVKDNAYLKI